MKKLLAVILALLSVAAIAAAAPAKPNILLVLCDDLGYGDLACFGDKTLHTPNLDRFAAEGLRLTSCYAAHGNCSPSRTALMTGRTPTRVGVRNWIPEESPVHVPRSEISVATLLKRAGYATCHSGKWHMNGQFNHPTHLALDASGALLVTDALNFRIQALSQDGAFLWKFGHQGNGSGDFAAPKGIAADAGGHYYVVDALFDLVQIFDQRGQLLLVFGERGEQPGQLMLPRGIFVSEQDKVYVADAYNHRVQVFQGAIATGKESTQ